MGLEELRSWRRFAEALALECREPILSGIAGASVSIKADRTVVTEVDVAVQRHVFDRIRAAHPDHALVGEEEGVSAKLGRRLPRFAWVIDPIDGTRNYAAGYPCFATSIAVLEDGLPVVGVVHEHVSGYRFSAARGCGATLNGQVVRVDDAKAFPKAMVGIPTSMDAMTQRVVGGWFRRDDLILRNTGSAAFHLALVACGALNAAYSYQCKVWDIAAGAVLVEEAGGTITGLRGERLFPWHPEDDAERNLPCLAAAPLAHARLIADFPPSAASA